MANFIFPMVLNKTTGKKVADRSNKTLNKIFEQLKTAKSTARDEIIQACIEATETGKRGRQASAVNVKFLTDAVSETNVFAQADPSGWTWESYAVQIDAAYRMKQMMSGLKGTDIKEVSPVRLHAWFEMVDFPERKTSRLVQPGARFFEKLDKLKLNNDGTKSV